MATWSNDGSSLTSQQWRQAEEIFLNALELPPHSRREYVAQSRDVDDVVRAQVNLLLAGHEVPDGPLKSTDGNCDLSSPIRDPLPIPALIGPYRLLELIGRGGMGAVYRAERADGHFQKQVAIKLINPEVLSPRSIERFRAERQMLAALEHPGVTRMLDGGSGRDGQHYIVMEYIEGVPVTRFCLDKSLSTRKIVQLFLQVCSAVQFVHSYGIVHRDLKPGNILVTPDGTVKLLDFGISRLQFDPATASPRPAQDFLREESRPFTVDYASPEQLLGSPPRFACDIYSLGVLLYELLSGERPFRQTGNWFPGDITVRLDNCPAPPSKTIRKRGSPAGRSSQITSELDAITLKALSRDPTLRYQSPQEFAADLQRYLDDRPVIAREYSIVEHVLTFIRRRRGLMAVAVLLLLFVTGAVRERHMALMERRIAEERLRKSWQSAVLLMDDVDTRMAKLPNSWAARREMLSQAMTQLESLALDPQVSPSLKFDLARAYIKLGGIQDNGMWWGTGDFAAVARSYQRAARLLTEIEDEPQVARRDVLLTLSMVYRYITGAELFMGNFDHALESSSRAISALASLEQEKRTDSQVLTAMALALVSKGDVDQAMALSDPTLDWTKASKVYAAAIEEGSHRSDGVYGLMRVQLRLSFYHCYTGDPAKGMDYARNVLRLGNELNRLKHPAAAWLNLAAHERMGACYAHLHHATDAFVEFDKLVRGISRISEQNPEDVVPRQQLAWAYLKRAKALLTLKRVTDAQRDYAQVLALADTLPQLPQDTLRVPLWAMTYSGLSTIERQTAFSGATTRHHKSECAYLSWALTLFAEMQKRHGMDLDEREEMRFVANRATACGQVIQFYGRDQIQHSRAHKQFIEPWTLLPRVIAKTEDYAEWRWVLKPKKLDDYTVSFELYCGTHSPANAQPGRSSRLKRAGFWGLSPTMQTAESPIDSLSASLREGQHCICQLWSAKTSSGNHDSSESMVYVLERDFHKKATDSPCLLQTGCGLRKPLRRTLRVSSSH